MSAFESGRYRNLFAELGHSDEEILERVRTTFNTMFFGSDEERIYHEVGDDMGYVTDTGNNDVRTEGMSYAMMMCVQLNRKDVFDRLWKWVMTYMYMDETYPNHGYFGWSNKLDGTRNSTGPAPDGEEFFAMSLFFASHRFGDGEGIYRYSHYAREILRAMVHNPEPMFHPENHLIKFIPDADFTDPSYHLPHFYELFALWAYEEDRDFFREAARASRSYLHTACDPNTGMSPEYSHYDGSVIRDMPGPRFWSEHWHYYSDAYRTIANIGLDWEWFGEDSWERECAAKLQKYFAEQTDGESSHYRIYRIDGTPEPESALHPIAIAATNAQASLASDGPYALQFAEKLWDTPLRTGDRRYYDNCLYLFAMLALSGNYRIW